MIIDAMMIFFTNKAGFAWLVQSLDAIYPSEINEVNNCDMICHNIYDHGLGISEYRSESPRPNPSRSASPCDPRDLQICGRINTEWYVQLTVIYRVRCKKAKKLCPMPRGFKS